MNNLPISQLPSLDNLKFAVIGLGYVGLPLAVAFGQRYRTLGFDINTARIAELTIGRDSTREVDIDELASAKHLTFTAEPDQLADCNVYIVTVPTPIDNHKRPDFGPLIRASETIGRALKANDVVIYESTVYPGATEEVCVPVLERESGLSYLCDTPHPSLLTPHFPARHGFYVGYSPERINPGDRQHRLSAIRKITAGSTPEAANFVDALYASIISAGTHRASSIRVAEAAKVIENTQRDLNIALINELAMLFHTMDIDTQEVLEAAGTKWNFLPFRPGLVGGHCIGVDPYYLTHQAQALGFHPEMVLAGRRVNDRMGGYIADRVIKLMTQHRLHVVDARVLVLGLTFKENCPDLRNTRVVDIVRELQNCNARVEVHDPWADPEAARGEYGIDLVPQLEPGRYEAIVLAVGHQHYAELGAEAIRALGRPGCVLFDVKSLLPAATVDGRL